MSASAGGSPRPIRALGRAVQPASEAPAAPCRSVPDAPMGARQHPLPAGPPTARVTRCVLRLIPRRPAVVELRSTIPRVSDTHGERAVMNAPSVSRTRPWARSRVSSGPALSSEPARAAGSGPGDPLLRHCEQGEAGGNGERSSTEGAVVATARAVSLCRARGRAPEPRRALPRKRRARRLPSPCAATPRPRLGLLTCGDRRGTPVTHDGGRHPGRRGP